MNRILAATAIALALCAPVAAHADADAAFAAAIKADPCFAPTPDTPDSPRIGAMAAGMSVETAALGASKNPAAEARAMAAIKADIADMTAAMNARDVATSSALMCKFHALTDAELARQLAGETPDEQARIATFLRDGRAEITQSLNPDQDEAPAPKPEAAPTCDAKKSLLIVSGNATMPSNPHDYAAAMADAYGCLRASRKAEEADAAAASAHAAEAAARKAAEKEAADKAEADRPRIEAEAKAKIEAERAQIEADAKAKVRAQIEADLRAKAEAEAKAKAEADAKAEIEAAAQAKDAAAAQFKAAEEARMEAEAVARNENNVRAAKMAREASVRADKEAAATKATEEARLEAEAKARHEDNIRDAKAKADAAARLNAANLHKRKAELEKLDDMNLSISCRDYHEELARRQRDMAKDRKFRELLEASGSVSGEDALNNLRVSCDVLNERGKGGQVIGGVWHSR